MVHVIKEREPLPCPPLDFEKTGDLDLVRAIITTPHIYRAVTDDGAGPVDEFRVHPHPAVTYLIVTSGDKLFGMFAFHPENTVTWQVHTCLLENAAGIAVQIAKQAIEWVWQNTGCLRIVTRVPVYNCLALRLAKQAGMSEFGTDFRCFLKNGALYDEILLGVSHPEVMKCL